MTVSNCCAGMGHVPALGAAGRLGQWSLSASHHFQSIPELEPGLVSSSSFLVLRSWQFQRALEKGGDDHSPSPSHREIEFKASSQGEKFLWAKVFKRCFWKSSLSGFQGIPPHKARQSHPKIPLHGGEQQETSKSQSCIWWETLDLLPGVLVFHLKLLI